MKNKNQNQNQKQKQNKLNQIKKIPRQPTKKIVYANIKP